MLQIRPQSIQPQSLVRPPGLAPGIHHDSKSTKTVYFSYAVVLHFCEDLNMWAEGKWQEILRVTMLSCQETNGPCLSPQAQQLVFTQHGKGNETSQDPCHSTWRESLSRTSIHPLALPRQDGPARELRKQSACSLYLLLLGLSRYNLNLPYEKKCEETIYRIYLTSKNKKSTYRFCGCGPRLLVAKLQPCAALKKGVTRKTCKFIAQTTRDHSDYLIPPSTQERQFLWEDRLALRMVNWVTPRKCKVSSSIFSSN